MPSTEKTRIRRSSRRGIAHNPGHQSNDEVRRLPTRQGETPIFNPLLSSRTQDVKSQDRRNAFSLKTLTSAVHPIHHESCSLDSDSMTDQQSPSPPRTKQCIKILLTITSTLLLLAVLSVCASHITLSPFLPKHHSSSPPNALPLFQEDNNISGEIDNQDVVVETDCFRFMGLKEEKGFSFRGISYALPPTGNLRWKRPVGLDGCREDLQASRNDNHKKKKDRMSSSTYRKKTVVRANRAFGSECFQVNPYNKNYSGSEDCLYLNVWTPTLDPRANLTVMVWIHGGFLQFGSGHQKGLSPSTALAAKLNTVFVSFNFRLHALGFVSAERLEFEIEKRFFRPSTSFIETSDSIIKGEGNYGLWDIALALEWVQDNIQMFGGSPSRVTLFGPDSAGSVILGLASSPNVRVSRLFQRGWMMDPAVYYSHPSMSSMDKMYEAFLTRSGCLNISCFWSLTPHQVTQHFLGMDDPSFRINDQNDLPIQGIFPGPSLIIPDGELVRPLPSPSSSFDLKSLPSGMTHDFLIGSTAQSIEFWPGPSDLRFWTWEEYTKYVTTSLDSFGPSLSHLALSVYSVPTVSSEDLPTSATTRMRTTSTDAVSVGDGVSSTPTTSKSLSLEHDSSSPSAGGEENLFTLNPSGKGERMSKMKQSTHQPTAFSNIKVGPPLSAILESTQSTHASLDMETKLPTTTTHSLLLPIQTSNSKDGLAVTTSKTMEGPLTSTESSSPSTFTPSNENVSSSPRTKRGINSDDDEHEHRVKNIPPTVREKDTRQGNTMMASTFTRQEERDDVNEIILLAEEERKTPSLSSIETPEFLYASMVSDVRQTCPVNKLAEDLAASLHLLRASSSDVHRRGRIFRYIITSHPSTPIRVYGYESKYAFHLWDTIAFFDQMDCFLKDMPTAGDIAFRDNIHAIVLDFVKGRQTEMTAAVEENDVEGKSWMENGDGGSRMKTSTTSEYEEKKESSETKTILWEEVPLEVALIGSFNVSRVSYFKRDHCAFWQHHGLLDYYWVS